VHEGIDTGDVVTIPGTATGFAAVLVDEDGENQIAVAPGANHRLGADHVRGALRARPLHVADIVVLGFEVPDPPLVEAARHAHDAGATVLVNPAPARRLAPELGRLSPILTPNAHELLALAGRRPAEPVGPAAIETAARRLSADTGAAVAVTLGAEGVLAVVDGRVLRRPAPAVAVRDTTGAGDAFSGVLAAALASGTSFSDAVGLATTAASLSTTGTGPRAALPNRDQVLAAD
jgi:ribokinase